MARSFNIKQIQSVIKKIIQAKQYSMDCGSSQRRFEKSKTQKPKGTKDQRSRPMRLAKIKQNLVEAEQKILEYRQIQINNRPLSGLDSIIQKTIPYWLSQKAKEAIIQERQAQTGKTSKTSLLPSEDKRKTFGNKKK
ncbi:hypothetical protein IMG5_002310 [Ichthyophthirius multifiliis]|uniref:Uncharacterized protein n=1 Tax=Ichthyophthirius multifiliis TaxID=5932 RepID=G0QJ34_ICHMU|nr:hypothetical protein IMG5_002310 [Ichthyophthirius multifiliis]EGR34758.1 hypothetical protein IMG5_002310 [Ichthyophthirius multifiliis]|eukprot:XP_004040062.1 hypothetical protein IMG5_002310 [Ichthyophthirius multifiliis]